MDPLQIHWTTLLAIAGYVAANPPVRAAIVWASSIVAPAISRVPVRRLVTPLALAVILAALLADAPAAAQMRRGRSTGATNATGATPGMSALVANFEGTLKVAGKKGLTVELTNGNTVEFRTTKKTEFLDDKSKKVQLKDLEIDALIKIEGVKDPFGYITANKVILASKVDPPEASKLQ
jgi:energy-coupling factor transporter transmembrane protein EcfT